LVFINHNTHILITMSEMLIVKSKIKEVNPELNVGGDVAEALNEVVHETLKKAGARAVANGRKTIGARDL